MRTFLVLLCSIFTLNLVAQDTYTLLIEDDNTVISYQVLEVKKKGQLIPELRLSIENKSEKYITVNFELIINYEMTFAEGTKVEGICIAPGKVKKGKIKGLFYNPEGLSFAQLTSDDIEVLVEEQVVTEHEKCK